MRLAALYDIHGNLPALEAVLHEIDQLDVDTVLVGGDVATGPMPSETLELLRAYRSPVYWIRGNCERELRDGERSRAPADVLGFVRSRLTDGQRSFLVGLPEGLSLDVDGVGRTLLCHATPRDDAEILTAASADARWLEALAGASERTVVCGHTHMQFDRQIGGTRLVNAGSVGMPYEDAPGAYWVLLGPDVELRRTEYDVAAALEVFAEVGYPGEWPQASRDEALELFERWSRA